MIDEATLVLLLAAIVRIEWRLMRLERICNGKTP